MKRQASDNHEGRPSPSARSGSPPSSATPATDAHARRARRVADLPTPAFLVHLPTVKRNCRSMLERTKVSEAGRGFKN